MLRKIFLLIFTLMGFFNITDAQTASDDPLVGYFVNAESQLELRVKKTGAVYSGDFIFQGTKYPYIEGYRFLGILTASYSYNGNMIPFSMARSGDEFSITTDGVTLPMVKKSSDPAFQSAQTTTTPVVKATTESTATGAATGTRYKDPDGAYSFQVPAGCTVKEITGGFQITAKNNSAQIVVSPHGYASKAALKKEVVPVVDQASGTNLKVTSSDYGSNGLFVRYAGTSDNKQTVVETIALISSDGGGTTVTASLQGAAYNAATTDILKSIANSMQFSKATVSTDAQQWIKRLKGKQLLYLYTASGYSEKYSYDLCANNRFVATGDNSYTSTGYDSNSSAVTTSGGNGSWKIISQGNATTLVLTSNDGQTKSFTLTARTASNEVGMNGKRYFIQDSKVCN